MSIAEQIGAEMDKIAAAKQELDRAAEMMALALLPRLHRLSGSRLIELKKALRRFDMHRRMWRDPA